MLMLNTNLFALLASVYKYLSSNFFLVACNEVYYLLGARSTTVITVIHSLAVNSTAVMLVALE